MHLAPLIRDLAVILAIAGLISVIFQRIRQPLVLGYIIAGMVIGPHTPPFQLITDLPSIQTWAELGVIFLMFTLGLEFSFRKLVRVGGSAVITAGLEVLFFLPVGFWVGRAFGWSNMDSVFLGAMLSISSTTIIIKALDELKLKRHRFAELIFAALIVEDLFAILLLVGLGTVAESQTISAIALLTAALKLVLVVGGWFLIGYFVVPQFMRYVGKIGSDEILTILSLGLCLVLVVFANHFHYSTALGAFIMGSILAESSVLPRIEHNMASLRDLFGAIFFVSIGMLIDPRAIWAHKGTILVICLVTILGKILSTGLGALISGQGVRNSVQVGFGLAQIGEFSFIIAQLGLSLKVTSEFIYPTAVAVSLVTTFTTPYMIRASGKASEVIESWLPVRAREALKRYAAQAEARRAGGAGKSALTMPFLRFGINGLATSVLFVLTADWVIPFIDAKFRLSEGVVPFLGWLLALLFSSPFVWGMLTAFRAPGIAAESRPYFRAFSKLTALLWVSALSAEFFSGKYVFAMACTAIAIVFVVIYRNLESPYRWFESRFLSVFNPEQPEHDPAEVPFKHLAPWDAHLVKLQIHPNSALVMKKISEAALRVRYGVNIVAIQRGYRSIVTPTPQEILLPSDELILLGTDEQIEKLKSELEESTADDKGALADQTYELRQLRLSNGDPFIDQTIRQSGIRERHSAMVVGIDRGGSRMINPDSDLKLLQNDMLWIVGEKRSLESLIRARSAVRSASTSGFERA